MKLERPSIPCSIFFPVLSRRERIVNLYLVVELSFCSKVRRRFFVPTRSTVFITNSFCVDSSIILNSLTALDELSRSTLKDNLT